METRPEEEINGTINEERVLELYIHTLQSENARLREQLAEKDKEIEEAKNDLYAEVVAWQPVRDFIEANEFGGHWMPSIALEALKHYLQTLSR